MAEAKKKPSIVVVVGGLALVATPILLMLTDSPKTTKNPITPAARQVSASSKKDAYLPEDYTANCSRRTRRRNENAQHAPVQWPNKQQHWRDSATPTRSSTANRHSNRAGNDKTRWPSRTKGAYSRKPNRFEQPTGIQWWPSGNA